MIDSQGRVLRDLRVSVTDRCNFRCLYCLPETEEAAGFYQTRFREPGRAGSTVPIPIGWKPKHDLLTFEEIERVARLAVGLGLNQVRITGGEPLLRRDLESLIGRVARLAGIEDLALTSNGFLFAAKAQALRDAGLRRVSFSLDSLDRQNFRRITGRDGLAEVLAAVQRARALGFHPIKINAVVIRGLNDHELPDLAAFARRERLSLRFIEFMPLDSGRAWTRALVVPGREVLERLQAHYELVPVPPRDPAETARRWRFADGAGELGIIAPVTEPFCGHCNRLRLTADGKIRTCLFSLGEHDLRPLLRGGGSDEQLVARLRQIVQQKEERHHIGETDFVRPARTMSCIGG